MKFHPSTLGLIMTDAQSVDRSLVPPDLMATLEKMRKTDADRELLAPYKEASLSAGAKTFLNNMAKEEVYNYKVQIETKYMDKGLACEDEAIQMLNYLRFKSYEKNTERRESMYLTGECDIYVPSVKTIDTKVAWSLFTFPAVSEDAHDSLYEWQGRAYMKLWDVPEHEVCWLMLDTPEELIRYEQRDLHIVNHIPPEMRLTSICYTRDATLESKMDAKCATAMDYLLRRIDQIHAERVPQKTIILGAVMINPEESPVPEVVDTRPVITVELEESTAPAPAPEQTAPPTLRLGMISERLGLQVTAAMMLDLGFTPSGKDKAAVLFHEHEFPNVCVALVDRINAAKTAWAVA
jgi:hypothetical protein